MIERITVGGKWVHLYKDRYYTVTELSKHKDCLVSYSVVQGRLSRYFNPRLPPGKFNTIYQIMTIIDTHDLPKPSKVDWIDPHAELHKLWRPTDEKERSDKIITKI